MVKKGKELSAEEKALLKEQQALSAQEEKERKAEMALKFLKEKLQQEEANSRISKAKLNAQWLDIMRKAKSEELRNEILILSQMFERVVDRKEAILQSLVAYLSESEQQDFMSARTHMRNVDTLIALQEERVAQLHAEFDEDLHAVTAEFMAERGKILEHHQREMTDLKDILFTMQGLHADIESEAANDLNSKRDEIRTRSLEAKSTLKATLEGAVSELWELYQQTLKAYEHSTADKKAEFERLKERDAASSETIAQQARRLQRLQEKIAARKAQALQTQREFEQRNKDLKTEKEAVLVHLQRLKEQMASTRARARSSLTQLTIDSRACLDALKERLSLGETILKQAEVCRKLETDEEKILPFYADTAVEGLETPAADEKTATAEAQAFTVDGVRVDERTALDLFWKRYNKVLLDGAAVAKEREDKAQENARLRALLKQYLDGISVNEEVLSQNNSLFIVNNRSNVPAAVPVGDGRVAVKPAVVQITGAAVTGRRKAR
eukprot:m.224672 g.224672  ORF g.224672 m.224672 type:complete len:498 (-) comp11131_c0_seq1:1772-3265(-)